MNLIRLLFGCDSYNYNVKGNAKYELGDYEGAMQDYTKAIEISPNKPEAYHLRALLKSELEDYREAILDFTMAIEFRGSALKSINNDSGLYYGRGFAEYSLGNYTIAFKDFNEAIRRNPLKSPPFAELAYHYRDICEDMINEEDSSSDLDFNF